MLHGDDCSRCQVSNACEYYDTGKCIAQSRRKRASILETYYYAARDWARDLRFDFEHVFITGCPFSDPHYDGVARLLVDAFLVLDDRALAAL